MEQITHLIAAARNAGASGIWLLANAAPQLLYDVPANLSEKEKQKRTEWIGLTELEATMADDSEPAALDLSDEAAIIVLSLPSLTSYNGLITLDPTPGFCRVCGCSEANACQTPDGTCSWVELDLCSACVNKPRAQLDATDIDIRPKQHDIITVNDITQGLIDRYNPTELAQIALLLRQHLDQQAGPPVLDETARQRYADLLVIAHSIVGDAVVSLQTLGRIIFKEQKLGSLQTAIENSLPDVTEYIHQNPRYQAEKR